MAEYYTVNKEVLLSKLRESNKEQTIRDAIVNVLDGLSPKTTGRILLTEMKDGTYVINDGFHRVAKAVLARKMKIKATVRKIKNARVKAKS